MGQQEVEAVVGKRFGSYLRRIREDRRLSLDAVEERSVSYPERVTKSHLSRIETGKAIPTFPRVYALSRIYGVPIAELAERFDLDLRSGLVHSGLDGQTVEELLESAEAWVQRGAYDEALQLFEQALTQAEAESPAGGSAYQRAALGQVTCLLHLESYHSAKDAAEQLLNHDGLPVRIELSALYHQAQASYRLERFRVAALVLEQAKTLLPELERTDVLGAMFFGLKGNLHFHMGEFTEAVEEYARAIKAYREVPDRFGETRSRINQTSALIRIGKAGEARRILVDVVEVAKRHEYDRCLALAYGNLGWICYQERDLERAENYCIQSNMLARARGYRSVVFRNCYYLWKIAAAKGDSAGERTNLKTLKTLLNRINEIIPEVSLFRSEIKGSL